MRSGSLRHVIKIQSITRTPDGQGGFTNGYTDFLTTRASTKAISSREVSDVGQSVQEDTREFTVRYRPGYTTTQFVQYNGDRYEIISIDNVGGLNREVKIKAVRRNPDRSH